MICLWFETFKEELEFDFNHQLSLLFGQFKKFWKVWLKEKILFNSQMIWKIGIAVRVEKCTWEQFRFEVKMSRKKNCSEKDKIALFLKAFQSWIPEGKHPDPWNPPRPNCTYVIQAGHPLRLRLERSRIRESTSEISWIGCLGICSFYLFTN